MNNIDRGQVNTSAAEIYDEFFVPALFQDWPERIIGIAGIQQGQRVLDVACGTGILTRQVAKRVGSAGSVIGMDVNEGMLAVAQRKSPQIEWRSGVAESLPFDDNSFDTVVCQFALMFFEDRTTALNEMLRVVKPGGHIAIAVWDTLENTLGYAAMVDLLQRLFGDEAANGIRAPYNLGDTQQLRSLFDGLNLTDLDIKTVAGTACFPSIESWMYTDIKGWVLSDMIDDAQFELLLKNAQIEMAKFVTSDGKVEFDAPAHIVSATKTG